MSAKRVVRTNRILRLASVTFLLAIIWNLSWVLTNLNLGSIPQAVFSVVFAAAAVFVGAFSALHVINNWHFRIATPKLFTRPSKPQVGVLIPVWSESTTIVANTVQSVLCQKWPADKLVIVVTDDGHSDALKEAIERIAETATATLLYFRPPQKDSLERQGEGKAGNLNAAKDYLVKNYPQISYIETRDSDDLAVNECFTSYCVQYLESYPKTSFVQTIKQCRVSDGDPFSNQESMFYQRSIPARFASNAVFPCGSGLMWRRRDLEKIGGFPSWNLVEDLQSGYEILRLGGQGAYLPVIGALGQIAPEDIPNFYKQRGTWALDTLRLFYYRNPLFTKGFTFMQKLHFLETQLAYLLSFTVVVFLAGILLGLTLGITPIVSPGLDYFLHLTILAAALEVYTMARARGISYKEQWVARQIWLGLMPVFMISALRALWYGPNRKPKYKLTKKYHTVGWYWRETLVQSVIFAALVSAVFYGILAFRDDPWRSASLQFWALYMAYGFSRVVANGRHNYRLPLHKLFARRAAE